MILSADVADRLGCSRETARRKLGELYERGDVDRRKVSRRVLYWRAGEPAAISGSQERVRTAVSEPDRPDTTGDGSREQREPVEETTSSPTSVDLGRLRDALPGSGEILEARVDAILAMCEYLQEQGFAEKRDLLGVVDAAAVGYTSSDSVWANMVEGRDTLRALPGVEPLPSGRTEWRYVEENGSESTGGDIYDPTEEF